MITAPVYLEDLREAARLLEEATGRGPGSMALSLPGVGEIPLRDVEELAAAPDAPPTLDDLRDYLDGAHA
jgi:hypothetical protein